MKKLLLFFTLCVPMLVQAIDVTLGGIKYSIDGTEATVIANSYSGEINIPATVNYLGKTVNVTRISDNAFKECSITSVTIGNSVTSIGKEAFAWCYAITSISIPNSVTSIGKDAFKGCRLTSITIPNSVKSIGDNAFGDRENLSSVNITCKDTDDFANYIQRTDKGSVFPFKGKTNIYIAGELQKDITIPNSVTSIGNNAFCLCSGLTSITIPNSVTSIGNSAFEGCSGLTSITIPNSVTSIGNSVFRGCSSLTSVSIPNSVTSIGDNAFYNCGSLTSVSIPNSVTSIGNSVFRGCSSLTSVSIPNSVTSIGNSVFRGCSGLTSVSIPNSVTSIGDNAFYNCSSLTSITIPNSVTSIGNSAFRGCSGLTSITIPNSVKSIGNTAFYDCSGLTSVNITDLASWCNIDYGDDLANPTNYARKLVLNGTEIKELVIPEGVTKVKNYAFRGCSGLTSVSIPNSVTSIGTDAFRWCSGLTSILCYSQTPPTCGPDIVSDYSMCTLCVSRESINSYKKAEIWSKFTKIYPIEAHEWQKLLSECKAIYDANSSEYKLGNALISAPNSFSTNANETREGDITKLIDGDSKTYWHSDWSKSVDPHTHYLQVALPEAIGGTIMMKMGRRIENNRFSFNDHPVKMSAEFSNDGTTFSGLTYFDTPFNQTVENPYVTAIFDAPEGTKYIRLYNEQSNDLQRGYWHCSEMQFYTAEYVVGRNERDPETSSLFGQMLQDALNRDPGQITQKDIDEFKEAYQYYFGQLGYVSSIQSEVTGGWLYIGQSVRIPVTISPENAEDKSVTWTSSNPEVVSVDETGLLTSLSAGEATIICRANDGGGASVSFEVYSAVFATNYRPSANATNTQRHITSIGITEQDGEPQNVNISTGKVYNDLTETAIFEVTEGSTVTANIGYDGSWMHGYFYIDLNDDHRIAYNPNHIDQTDTEVFSYSFWSGDENNGESGQNSAGQTLTGNNRNSVVNNVITLPTFTAPAAGTYNVRFKVDWNCIDPAGNTTDANYIFKNGGYIVDAVLKVNPGKTTDIQGLSTSSDAQTIYDLSGRRIEVSSRGLYIQNGRKVLR